MPFGSGVFSVWIQGVSLLRIQILSALARQSMVMTLTSSKECCGRLKCLATGVSLPFRMSNLWSVNCCLSVCDVWPTYCLLQ